jgi:hypothetical protein
MTRKTAHTTIRRTLGALLAATVAGSLLVGGVAAQDNGVAPQIDEQPIGTELAGVADAASELTGTVTAYDEVMGNLHSEYLREMAADWGLEGSPSTGSVDLSQLHSEYLREIAADW